MKFRKFNAKTLFGQEINAKRQTCIPIRDRKTVTLDLRYVFRTCRMDTVSVKVTFGFRDYHPRNGTTLIREISYIWSPGQSVPAFGIIIGCQSAGPQRSVQ